MGVTVYGGPFGREQAERLLWRAGFGPRPGEADALAKLGLRDAVHSPTRPGVERFVGPTPRDDKGRALAPATPGATTTSGGRFTLWCSLADHPSVG